MKKLSCVVGWADDELAVLLDFVMLEDEVVLDHTCEVMFAIGCGVLSFVGTGCCELLTSDVMVMFAPDVAMDGVVVDTSTWVVVGESIEGPVVVETWTGSCMGSVIVAPIGEG